MLSKDSASRCAMRVLLWAQVRTANGICIIRDSLAAVVTELLPNLTEEDKDKRERKKQMRAECERLGFS